MAIWILTIGSNDVQLENNNNWQPFKRKVKKELGDLGYSGFTPKEKEHAHNKITYTIAARALGIVYDRHLTENYNDLVFPLLDSFSQRLEQEEKVDRVVYLLTDQTDFFQKLTERQDAQCPFWQDTVKLQPIIENYFQHNLPEIKTDPPIILKPEENTGLDDWSSVLSLVQKALANISVGDHESIYVSHQAGTPAISSAVQFVSLSRFGDRVKFLVSNEFNTEPAAIIEGSKYLEGIQIQQAKKLITTGSPGAAQKLFIDNNNLQIGKEQREKLDKLVDIFNIANPDSKEEDFEIEVAITRVMRALELVEIYFRQRNYIQGITLLSAAQETFMKTAVLYRIRQIPIVDDKHFNFKPSDILEWTNKGLYLVKDKHLKPKIQIYMDSLSNLKDESDRVIEEEGLLAKVKIDLLNKIGFPIHEKHIDYEEQWIKKYYRRQNDNERSKDIRFDLTNSNYALLLWLKSIYGSDFDSWNLLEWIGIRKRRYEDDKRNQLIHNLRGVEKIEVIKYLLGYKGETVKDVFTKSIDGQVAEVYRQQVKIPFIKSIDKLGLPYQKSNLQEELDNLADGLDNFDR